MKIPTRLIPFVFLPLLGCQSPQPTPDNPASPSLQEAARGLFRIGAALNAAQITGEDGAGSALVATHFDSITAENAMKWEHIQPEAGRFDFALADRFVALGVKHRKQIIGHTLVWHAQAPDWLFKNADGSEVSREELLARLRTHIATVVGRYRGRVAGWDVVNEAIRDEDGLLRTEKPWYRILGEDAVFAAFEAAHAADPDAELYYNDYAMDNPVKRAGVLKLVAALRARGLRIDGVGSQGHYGLTWPTIAQIDAELTDFAQAGLKVMYTELDVTTLPRPDNYGGAEVSRRYAGSPEFDPYTGGLPAAKQAELARRYAELFAVFAKHHRTVDRVTLWGVADGTSWLNYWPILGRTDHPLLFDRDARPKPAFDAVVTTLRQASRDD